MVREITMSGYRMEKPVISDRISIERTTPVDAVSRKSAEAAAFNAELYASLYSREGAMALPLRRSSSQYSSKRGATTHSYLGRRPSSSGKPSSGRRWSQGATGSSLESDANEDTTIERTTSSFGNWLRASERDQRQ
jgi:hypothetical protein